ncbi:MAG TPA: DUF4911 domain-containing protein [Fervidobacterium sp.]|nr:DUF4911 domain-containing protein [Fervidobacterium sp.]HOL03028.1 DUF4911 domain-containing protein [Fervidobacterium sp.]HOV52883.1 DUF4911 domain-containing protein [Fervidobacterium sp.]HRB90587.1 DUF4911 domain-containing protein [Fervidobacterium sp.]HRT01861.1 DUF4911 domain-containing protein [Fervidobacterium sp.]
MSENEKGNRYVKNNRIPQLEISEYDIIVKMERENVHMLNYILEAEDNIMNIRSFEGDYLRVIATKDTVIDAIRLLESVKEYIDLEIVELRPNNGKAN